MEPLSKEWNAFQIWWLPNVIPGCHTRFDRLGWLASDKVKGSLIIPTETHPSYLVQTEYIWLLMPLSFRGNSQER